MTRRLAAAGLIALLLGSPAAFAQAPPPVPALPDTTRLTSYTIAGTNCACLVNFALYGDGTDYQNWLLVTLNGQFVNYSDPISGWTITSPTGPLGSIARPITDAKLTFNSPQTGTVQIIGARRPRRTSQFQENQGVTARDLNQVLTDIVAQNREAWDARAGAGAALALPSIQVSVRSSSANTVTLSATTDYFICLDPTSNPITVNLPASPVVGLTYLIKDCTGQSALHAITITPASGNIDGVSTATLSVAFQSMAVTYTGSQWSIN